MPLHRLVGLALMTSFVIGGAPSVAQEAADPIPMPAETGDAEERDLPEASELFNRHIEAAGGLETIKSFESRRLRGTLKVFFAGQEDPVMTGVLRLTAAVPNIIVQEIIFPGQSTQVRTFDGKAGWLIQDGGEPTPIEGEELERFVVSSRFYAEADYENHYKNIKTVDQQEGDDDTLNIVEVEHWSGRKEAFVFSESSGFLVAIIGQRLITTGEQAGNYAQFQRTYEEYEEFDGMKFATHVREFSGNQIIELEFTEIEHDIETPSIERPAGIEDAEISGFQKS